MEGSRFDPTYVLSELLCVANGLYCTVTAVDFHCENRIKIYDNSVNVFSFEHKTRHNCPWRMEKVCTAAHTLNMCTAAHSLKMCEPKSR